MKQVKFIWDEKLVFGIVECFYLDDIVGFVYEINVPELPYTITLPVTKATVC